jgi:large subunit ribosomal protein L21
LKYKEKTMYAVVKTGGKQYRVTAGDIIEIEKLEGDAGATITFGEILSLSGEGKNEIGAPLVKGAAVEAQILAQTKGDKVIIFKKKRRHNYRRKNGHRQQLTAVQITGISLNGTSLAKAEARAPKAKAAPQAKADKKTAAKPAAKKTETAAKKPAAKKPAAKKAAK